MMKKLLSILVLLTLFIGVSAIDVNTGGQTPYTIKYNANGGTGTMPDQQCNSVYESTLNPNAFSKTGYVFDGWSLIAGGAVAFPDEARVMIDDFGINAGGNITLYAKWVKGTITIDYNGGTHAVAGSVNGSMGSSTHEKGTGALSIVEYFKEGLAFLGWVQDSNTNYTVTFKSNGGATVHSIFTYKLPDELPAPTRTGYRFEGWYDNANLTGTPVSGGTKISGNMTLYAKWSETTPKYTLSYNSNGGSAVDSQRVSKIPSVLPIPTKSGYTLSNWFTDSGLTNVATGGTVLTQDTTLYAKWKANIMYAYVDASTYSSTAVTTAPSSGYYKTATQYNVTYKWTEHVSKTCSSDDTSRHYYETGKTSNSWSGCSSMCSSKGKGSCVDVRQDGSGYTWTCHASGNSCESSWDCGYDETKTGTTGWQSTTNAPSGKTYVSHTSRTVYYEVTGWGSRVSVTTPGSNTTTRKYQYSRDNGATWVDCDSSGCPTS